MDSSHLAQQLMQLFQFFFGKLIFDAVVTGIDFADKVVEGALAFFGELEVNSAVIVGRAQAHHQFHFFQAGEDAGEAGAQDAGAACQVLEIHRTVFGQEAQDTPLLVGEADFVEQRAKMRHQRFARLY